MRSGSLGEVRRAGLRLHRRGARARALPAAAEGAALSVHLRRRPRRCALRRRSRASGLSRRGRRSRRCSSARRFTAAGSTLSPRLVHARAADASPRAPPTGQAIEVKHAHARRAAWSRIELWAPARGRSRRADVRRHRRLRQAARDLPGEVRQRRRTSAASRTCPATTSSPPSPARAAELRQCWSSRSRHAGIAVSADPTPASECGRR